MGYRANLQDQLPQIAEICRRYGVSELLLFGSGLGPNFRADSDLDFLVEFHPGVRIGLVQFIHLKHELESTLGRDVDIIPKRGLKSLIRDSVLRRTELVYAG
jgi:predicted nucleotidyltransferase